MGKFVRISLATKFRLVFGSAVLIIIAAALLLPWYFLDLLAAQEVERPAAWVTYLRLSEWVMKHPSQNNPASMPSEVARYYQADSETTSAGAREGPDFISLAGPRPALNARARSARKALERGADPLYVADDTDPQGHTFYQCFRAVRADKDCMACHGSAIGPGIPHSEPAEASVRRPPRFEAGQLVGMIHMTMPASAATTERVWWTRLAIIAGGSLAALLALVVFAIITQRLVLRPVHHLRNVSDKVAEGDLTVRSTVATGDELQHLGDSFNEMLTAISDQHDKLRAANRALDLRMHELGEANVTLFQANKVKNEFLANVSHELRTPLNSIIGFADLVAQAPDERLRRYGNNIAASAKSLLAMINDLLDFARIEAGKAEVRLGPLSVLDLCQTMLTLMAPLAEKKQLALESHLGEMPLITTDGSKVQQILFNLLSNAIKFTPPGGRVTLESRLAGAEALVSVADTGPGIAEADQLRVFEKFYQSDRSLTRESQGTGLGLAISKELASLLGGRLTLKSSPGAGAEFTLALPVEPPQTLSAQPAAAAGNKTAS